MGNVRFRCGDSHCLCTFPRHRHGLGDKVHAVTHPPVLRPVIARPPRLAVTLSGCEHPCKIPVHFLPRPFEHRLWHVNPGQVLGELFLEIYLHLPEDLNPLGLRRLRASVLFQILTRPG